MPTPKTWTDRAADILLDERNKRYLGMTEQPMNSEQVYRWEPVKGDCTRHFGPHEGFRCNGAYGRLIAEPFHAESFMDGARASRKNAAALAATPPEQEPMPEALHDCPECEAEQGAVHAGWCGVGDRLRQRRQRAAAPPASGPDDPLDRLLFLIEPEFEEDSLVGMAIKEVKDAYR